MNEELARSGVTIKVPGYGDGWRGVLDHALDVFRGRPVRSTRDVTISCWVKGNGQLEIGAINTTKAKE